MALCQKVIFCWISSINLNILPSGYRIFNSHWKIVISRTLNTHKNIYGETLCNWATVEWKLQVLAFCQKLIFCWISSMNLNILSIGYRIINSHRKIVISRTLNTHKNISGGNLCNWATVVWKLQVLAFCQKLIFLLNFIIEF